MFRFNDGQTIKSSKAFLAAESDIFHELFMESSQDGIIEIKDYDYSTFKLFLDCLMGFQKCSQLDALIVFPIAWKYETFNLIEKCVDILKPTSLDENVCLALNLALFCKCKELMDEIMGFLTNENQIYKLLDDKKYFCLLEPETMAILLKDLKIDSCVLKNVVYWAKKYLKKKNKNIILKEFLKDYNIIHKLELTCFETSQSLFDFMKSDVGKDFFDLEDCWNYIEQIGHDKKKCKWGQLKLDENEISKKVVEGFTIFNVPFLEDYTTVVRVTRNPVVFYKFPEEDPDYDPDEDEEEEYDEEEKEEENKEAEAKEGDEESECNKEDMLQWTVKCTVGDNEVLSQQLFQENENANFTERQEAVFQFDYKQNVMSDLFLQIFYDFYFDCRILKTSMEPILYPIQPCRGDLNFTYSIHISHFHFKKE